MVFHCYLLHPEIFFPGDGKPGACFYSLIVGKDNALPAAYITYTGDSATRGTTPLFFIHFITGKSSYLNKGFVFVSKVFYSLSRRKLIFFFLFFNRFFTAAFIDLLQTLTYITDQQFHGIVVSIEFNIHCRGY